MDLLTRRALLLFISGFNCFVCLSSGGPSINASFKEYYHGIVLRVAAFNFSPISYVRKLSQGGYECSGVGPETVEMFAKHLNMTIQYVLTDPSEVARNGIISALHRQMDEREVDYVCFFFETIPSNIEHMDIANPAFVQDYSLLQPWPREESRLKVIARPFTPAVWICTGVTTLLFIGISSVFSYIQDKRSSLRNHRTQRTIATIITKQIDYVATIFTFQGNYVRYTATDVPFRIAVALWLLPTMIILFAFSGILTTMLTIPRFESRIDTFDELVEDGRMRLTIEEDVVFAKQFLNATSGSYKVIGDMLRMDPKRLFFTDLGQMLDNVINHHCVYPVNNYDIRYIIHADFKSTGKCRIIAASRPLPYFSVPFQFGNPKGSPYTRIIDKALIRLSEGGFRSAMVQRYIPPTDQCRLDNVPKAGIKQLSLRDLAAAFVILAIGLALSLTAFLFEILSIFLLRKGTPYEACHENGAKHILQKMIQISRESRKMPTNTHLISNIL